MAPTKEIYFRVKFIEKDKSNPIEVVVKFVRASDLPGLVHLTDFVFMDQAKKIITPEDEAARKRFHSSHALHIPYHNILSVEEFYPEVIDLKQLPFLREVDLSADHNLGP